MQRLFKIMIIPFLALFLCAGTGLAYTINDDTYVGVGSSGGLDGASGTGAIQDVIGADFDTYGIDVSFSGSIMTLDLYTKFDGLWSHGGLELTLADVFLTVDSGPVDGLLYYAIDLDGDHGATGDTYYTGGDWQYTAFIWSYQNINDNVDTSYDVVEKHSGYLYGEVWDHDANGTYNSAVPVEVVTAGESFGTFDLTRTDVNNSYYQYSISFDLESLGIESGDTIDIFWATATCANDIIHGTVPEPDTMFLLGTALMGLAGLTRRRLFKK